MPNIDRNVITIQRCSEPLINRIFKIGFNDNIGLDNKIFSVTPEIYNVIKNFAFYTIGN